MLRIGEPDQNLYSSDKKNKYILLDEPIKTGVLTAYTNQSKAT